VALPVGTEEEVNLRNSKRRKIKETTRRQREKTRRFRGEVSTNGRQASPKRAWEGTRVGGREQK